MESKNLEYKSDIPKKQNQLKAEIISFLNTSGGTIILGVDDDGNIIEEYRKKYKEWEELISNWIVNAFSPNVIEHVFLEIDKYFKIIIKKGNDKPYFYKDGEGFNSKGVYIRVGSSKRIASFEEIQRIIMAKKSSEYETLACDRDDLTFNYVKLKLERVGIKFDPKGLSLINADGRYNNAALLLSDQNPTVSKFAVFQGTTVAVFLDKKEFRGSIMEQLDNILYFANLSNRKKIVITGKKAQHDEYLDIPKMALREAICNCYCHRDWTLNGDIKIEYYDDRVMIFSPGSLPNGLTLENIKNGMTAKRNQIIVNALDKADFIENYASGVRRVFDDYIGFEKQPNYDISDNGVIVTLYNMNYEKNQSDSQKNIENKDVIKNDSQSDSQKNIENKDVIKNDSQSDSQKNLVTLRREKLLKLMKHNSNITSKDLTKILNVSSSTVNRDLAWLRKNNFIEYAGSSKTGKWIVKSNKK